MAKTLERDLNSELNGELLQFTVSLTYSMSEYMARELHGTMFAPGTDEASLTEILISRKSAEMTDIRNDFFQSKFVVLIVNFCLKIKWFPINKCIVYGFYLVDMIRDDTTGSMESLMVAMAEVDLNIQIIVQTCYFQLIWF